MKTEFHETKNSRRIPHHRITAENSKFTLIELLIVIAIIAILIAILLPALNKTRDMAYKIICTNQLKHLVMAEMSYASDYKNIAAFRMRSDGGGWITWRVTLRSGGYLKTGKMYYCPKLRNLDSTDYFCYYGYGMLFPEGEEGAWDTDGELSTKYGDISITGSGGSYYWALNK